MTSDRRAIEDLAHQYAVGTDAIGRGDLLVGQQVYAECFTERAIITAYFPGDNPDGPPGLSADGPLVWARAVAESFRHKGYQSTQHLIGTVRVDLVEGADRARMTCYLSATHVIDPGGCVELATGSYQDVVQRTDGGWRIAERTLVLISFLRLESPGR